MKTILMPLLALLSTSILVSCKKDQPGKNLVLAVDFSLSRDSSVCQWYKATIAETILRSMGMKDRLTILPVDDNSQTASQEIFHIDFGNHQYHNEYAGLQAEEMARVSHQDSVTKVIERFDRSFEQAKTNRMPFHRGTNIFGVLREAKKYANPKVQNLLIVFSDMLQYSDKTNMNFEDSLNTVEEIGRYLDLAETIDLTGFEIIVLTGPQPNISDEKFAVIEKFWEKYFEKCNTKLIDYSSGAVLKVQQAIAQE